MLGTVHSTVYTDTHTDRQTIVTHPPTLCIPLITKSCGKLQILTVNIPIILHVHSIDHSSDLYGIIKPSQYIEYFLICRYSMHSIYISQCTCSVVLV